MRRSTLSRGYTVYNASAAAKAQREHDHYILMQIYASVNATSENARLGMKQWRLRHSGSARVVSYVRERILIAL